MEKQNYRPCIGGILLLAAVALSIVSVLFSYLGTIVIISSVPSGYITAMVTTLVTKVLTSLPVILLGVMLMLKMRGLIITILSGIMMALSGISFVSTIISITKVETATFSNVNWFGNFILIACYATLLLLSITTTTPQPNGFKKLWFLPGVCYGLYAVSAVIFSASSTLSLSVSTGMLWDIGTTISMIASSVISTLPVPALYTAGYFLTGKWLANPYKKGYQPQPRYDEQTMQALNYYKWQYESGAITMEQYNAAIQPYLAQNNK